MNENKQPDSRDQQLESILRDLEDISDMLNRVNVQLGCLERFHAMKEEIAAVGWSGICARYHPDINMEDPAAIELFALYKYIYDTMQE